MSDKVKKVEFKPVELTQELVNKMAFAEMIDYGEANEIKDDRPKPIKRVWEHDQEVEAPEIDLYGTDGVEMNEVNTGTIEIDMDSTGKNKYEQWNAKFTDMMITMSSKYKLSKTFRSIMWKDKINGWLRFLKIPYRFPTCKERETIRVVIQDVFLQMNELDDDSIKRIEDRLKNCSIEGIRKNLPSGIKLWGANPVGAKIYM